MATPIQPWSGYHVHDPDRPAPKKIDPGGSSTQQAPGKPPSDAIMLFDGTDVSKWLPSKWIVQKGYIEATQGSLTTRQEFGSFQLHLEWQTPEIPEENVMNRGNNGVMLMGLFEIQIYESYFTKIYPDGQAAAIYSQTPPMVNACRKPGEWQSYDIVFFAPVYPARCGFVTSGFGPFKAQAEILSRKRMSSAKPLYIVRSPASVEKAEVEPLRQVVLIPRKIHRLHFTQGDHRRIQRLDCQVTFRAVVAQPTEDRVLRPGADRFDVRRGTVAQPAVELSGLLELLPPLARHGHKTAVHILE